MKYTKSFSFSKILFKLNKFVKNLKKEEKVFFIYLVILFFIILFLPIIKIINIEDNASNSMLLLRNNVYLFKSFLIILMSMFVLIGWNRSYKIRNVISLLFGFKEVPFLLNFGLLRIILTSYIGINEGVSVSQEATTRIELTSGYYIIIVFILFGLLYSLYLTLQQSKQSNNLNKIYTNENKEDNINKKMKGLFSKMKGE